MRLTTEQLIDKVNRKRIWDEEPVFCFTSDIDWASEDAIQLFFQEINPSAIKLTTFVTHKSEVIEDFKNKGEIELGIHPNFLPGSSHGNDFRSVIESTLKFAPNAKSFRSHRGFDVTDITHLLFEYGIEYDSNIVAIFPDGCRPIVHESGLVRFPIFFEDGTHLYNQLDLDLAKFTKWFKRPGVKILSFHPMNFVINTPEIKYMRFIKDSHSREEYANLSIKEINELRYQGKGITSLCKEIINFTHNYKIMSLSEIYKLTIS